MIGCVFGIVQQRYDEWDRFKEELHSHREKWDGNFPIPAGTEVEVHFDGDDCRVWTPFRVEYMCGDVVVLHDYRIDGVDAYNQKTLSFRPIRSEADKKRDEAISSMKKLWSEQCQSGRDRRDFDEFTYDCIAAGKIPHIRID